jgi:hypothetical protein
VIVWREPRSPNSSNIIALFSFLFFSFLLAPRNPLSGHLLLFGGGGRQEIIAHPTNHWLTFVSNFTETI